MKMPAEFRLRDLTLAGRETSAGFVSDNCDHVPLTAQAMLSALSEDVAIFKDRSVLILAKKQLSAALTLVELDGVARRLILLPPDVADAELPAIIQDAQIDAVVSDAGRPIPALFDGMTQALSGVPLLAHATCAPRRLAGESNTEWLLFTSGTSTRPKMVIHTLQGLMAPILATSSGPPRAIWSTFYDIRRYGGLQMFLRAFTGGHSMVLSDAYETVDAFLQRVAAARVSHISGTPSHWRLALMSAAISGIAPSYVRLSGEIADQSILNSLRVKFPDVSIGHAFASTEAGVAFEVSDGLAGFPAAWIEHPPGEVVMRIRNGSLCIRSSRTAIGYLNHRSGNLRDAEGFVDTGDIIAIKTGRCQFLGRRGGIINVGGKKVFPEEIEGVLNSHPKIDRSRVRARTSPITGSIVVADILLASESDGAIIPFEIVKEDILIFCRKHLERHKIPASLYQVQSLEVIPSGKLRRE